jgi:hypothetical protein
MKKTKREIVICLDDGYHEPHYYFQFGRDIYSRTHMTNFLCKPHKEEYNILTIYYDDIEETTDEYTFIGNFETMNRKDRIKNFEKLARIHYDTYS